MVKILKNLLISFLTIVLLVSMVSAENFVGSANVNANSNTSNSSTTNSATTTSTNSTTEITTSANVNTSSEKEINTSKDENIKPISARYNYRNYRNFSKNMSNNLRKHLRIYRNISNHKLKNMREHIVYTNKRFFRSRDFIRERINELKKNDIKLLIKEMRKERDKNKAFELRKMILMKELNRAKILTSIYETKIENSNISNKEDIIQGLEAVNIRINDYIKEINESKNISQLREIQRNLRNDFKTIKREVIVAHVVADINGYNRAIIKLQNVINLLNKTGIQTADLETQLQNIEKEYNAYKLNLLSSLKNSNRSVGETIREYRDDKEKVRKDIFNLIKEIKERIHQRMKIIKNEKRNSVPHKKGNGNYSGRVHIETQGNVAINNNSASIKVEANANASKR